MTQVANGGEATAQEVKELATKALIGGAVVTTCVVFSKNIQVSARRWPCVRHDPQMQRQSPCSRRRRETGAELRRILPPTPTQAIVAPFGPAYLTSPGGPFTIHQWPPMTKLLI